MLRTPPRFTDVSLSPLDEADRKLITMLAQDGRASGRELALATGISEANVSRRLARLFEERSIRVVGFVPPEYLGYHMQFALFLRAKHNSEALARRLAALPYFAVVVSTFGFCDVIAYGVAQHGPAMMEVLDTHVHGQPDVADVEVRIVLEFTDAARQPLIPGAFGSPRPLDATDRQIISAVQHDGRISFTELASSIGISPTSAADRFRRLVSDGIVRILGLPDPYRVGLMVTGYMYLMLDRPSREVQRELAKVPELSFIAMMTGQWPLTCEVMATDDAHLDDIRRRVSMIPGVRDLRIVLHRTMHRMGFAFAEIAGAAQTATQESPQAAAPAVGAASA